MAIGGDSLPYLLGFIRSELTGTVDPIQGLD